MTSSSGSSHRSSRNSDELSLASPYNDRSPGLNLPLDKEFLPLQTDREKRDQVICMIFDLPESTKFYEDYSCAIASTLAMHGRMYPTSAHVCFYSNVFGRERKILIPYESIRKVEKTTTMVFQNAIRLATFDKDEYTFTSFWGNHRDNCYDLIVKTRDRVLRELHVPNVGVSETRSSFPLSRTYPSSVASPPTSQCKSTFEEDTEDDEGEDEKEKSEAISRSDNLAVITNNDDTNAGIEGAGDDEHASSRRRSVVSDVDSIAPKDISMTQVLEEIFPVSVDTFMQTFFLDYAPFGLDKFGEQIGLTDMTVNPWTTPLKDENSFGMTRSLQFRVPIEAPIGPKSSQVDVLQCLKKNGPGVRVVESSTRLVDIPYGDYFSVEDRWTVVSHSSDPNSCKLFIELKVVFGKSTFWKKTIEARAISDNRAKWEKWVEMAKYFLCSMTRNDDAAGNPSTTSALLENSVPRQIARKDQRSVINSRSRRKPSHRQQNSTTIRGRTATVKVFPWVLVFILLLVILRLQMSLSSIERRLSENNELIFNIQKAAGLQAQCQQNH